MSLVVSLERSIKCTHCIELSYTVKNRIIICLGKFAFPLILDKAMNNFLSGCRLFCVKIENIHTYFKECFC